MNIQLNGEQKEIEATTIAQLVIELGLEKRTVAVEQNLEVVPKSAYAATMIEAGDRIEVVHMIGGG